MPAIWRNPSSRWRRGPRRSNRCRAACAEAGRRTARRGRRSGPQPAQGVSRGRHGRAAAQEQGRRPGRQASDATGSGRRRRRGPAPQGRGAGTGERGDAGGGGGSQKKTRAPAYGACRTGRRRFRSTVRARRIHSTRFGIAPGSHLLPPRQARGRQIRQAACPGGRGVRRFQGRARVPQGQGHAQDRRLGEGAPQDHGREWSDDACSRTTRVRLIRGRDHAGSRQPRRPRLHGRDAELETARGHHPGSRPGTGRACLSPPVDCHDGGIVAYTAGSGPNAGLANNARQGRGDTAGGSVSLGAFRPRMPLPVTRMAGAHGPLRPGTVDGRQGPFPGRRRRGGVPRTHEDGIRPSRALGGAHPQRGARPGRRLHPLARPRAHQTAARLDESGAIPSEPGNGRVTISKKTPAPPSRCLHIFSKRSGTIHTNFFSKPYRNQSTGTTEKH